MSWGVFKDGILRFETEVKSDAYAEGFHLGAFIYERGKTRLQKGWKIREVEDGDGPVQIRVEECGHNEEYVRTEEGGRIGRVVQRGSQDYPIDPEHKG